jgi:DNA-binding CsgD family transcriptional regulator
MLSTGSAEVFQMEQAARYFAEGIAFTRERNLDRYHDYMDGWKAVMDVYQGAWDAAGQRANAILEREHSVSTNRLTALIALGRLRTRRGDPGAGQVLDEALELATRSGTLQRIAPVRCIRAEAAWLAGKPGLATEEALAAFDLVRSKGHPWFLGELAFQLWRSGQLDVLPPDCAPPFQLQMQGDWRRAAQIWEGLHCPYEQARALCDGDEEAQRQALSILDALQARPMTDCLRQRMRASGIHTIPRGPTAATRNNPAGLTPREIEILVLIAEGFQNAEIARKLFRSPRTVDNHIAAIFSKLEVKSRTEAIVEARKRGLLA